jgi:hypothetical protein
MPDIQQISSGGINSKFSGNPYFSAEDKQLTTPFLGTTNTPFTVLRPKQGIVDVWRDLMWCNSGNRDEVPPVFVVEKELKYGTWATQFANILTQFNSAVNNKNIDSLLQLYNAEDTGFKYNFPWLLRGGSNIRSVSNSWANNEYTSGLLKGMSSGGGGGGLGDMAGALMGAAIGSITPGFGFEDTKAFSGTSEQELRIEFPLYNTLDLESAFKHFSFVNLFTFQNLKTRTSLMTFIPPKIYTVDTYAVGGIYMAAAYVSEFRVDSIGTTRAMSDFWSKGPNYILIPEAYKITIVFKDLLSQSSNVFAGAMGGVKVEITNAQAPGEALGNTVQTGINAAQRVIDGMTPQPPTP